MTSVQRTLNQGHVIPSFPASRCLSAVLSLQVLLVWDQVNSAQDRARSLSLLISLPLLLVPARLVAEESPSRDHRPLSSVQCQEASPAPSASSPSTLSCSPLMPGSFLHSLARDHRPTSKHRLLQRQHYSRHGWAICTHWLIPLTRHFKRLSFTDGETEA